MRLFYDSDDFPYAKKLKDERFKWLQEIGAVDLRETGPQATGFLFGYWHGTDHLHRLGVHYPNLRDRPEEKEELIRLDHVLERLAEHGIEVPTPRTWILRIDEAPPADRADRGQTETFYFRFQGLRKIGARKGDITDIDEMGKE